MICVFQKDGDNLTCINCSFSVPFKKYKNGITRECTKSVPKKRTVIKNLGKEIIKQAKNIVEKKTEPKRVLTEKSEAQNRLEICGNCDHFQFGTCGLCNCVMAFKTRLKESNCPIGKW